MQRIAIVGANGFIGSRALEVFHLSEQFHLRPVIRRLGALPVPARFNLEIKIADALDRSTLEAAFAGCDAVVDLVLGDAHTIVNAASNIYQAACASGVRRLIYVSSQAVHGQSPAPDTTEESVISIAQQLPYNSAKVRAERRLIRLREQASTELVILRPGIVFGPRSRWISDTARQLLNSQAYLIGDGRGICNSIYVDNLLEAIRLSIITPAADRQIFLLGDEETVTWYDFYSQIATGLSVAPDAIQYISAPQFEQSLRDLIEGARCSQPFQQIMKALPFKLKRSAKAAIYSLVQSEPSSAWTAGKPNLVFPTLEMTLLQQCQVKLPHDKARALLGYKAKVSFLEGCKRSIGWLKFAGFPISECDFAVPSKHGMTGDVQ